MASQSIFTALNAAASEIRLLKLLPGLDAEPIRCELRIVSLEKAPKYEALSYVCGDPTDTRTILVNGQRHNVYVNLEGALRGLRHSSRSRQLWADAVCINQDDNDEKNEQVQKMADIYTQASRVLVWLHGEGPSAAVETAVLWATRHRNTRSFLRHLKLRPLPVPGILARKNYLQELEKVISGSLEVLTHPYWTRIWTYQEYLLVRDDPLMMFGKLSFSAELLRNGCVEAMVKLHDVYGINVYHSITARCFRPYEVGMATPGWMETPVGPPYPQSVSESMIHHRPGRRHAFFLLHLNATATLACSDPRDRVYALYGLTPELKTAFPPDYNKSSQQVMHDMTIYMAGEAFDLDSIYNGYSLYENRLGTGSASSTGVPSWVADLTEPLDRYKQRRLARPEGLLPHQFKCFSRIPNFPEVLVTRRSLEVSCSGRLLRLPARRLGGVYEIIRFSKDQDTLLEQLADIFNSLLARSAAMFCTHPWDKIRPAVRPTVINRLATALFNMMGRELPSDQLLTLLCGVDRNVDVAVDDLAKRRVLAILLQGKTIFVARGRIGITVGDMVDGDEIVLAYGLGWPVVLRNTGSKAAPSKEFKLVGFAYLDGYMNTEFLDPELIAEALRLEERTFDIC